MMIRRMRTHWIAVLLPLLLAFVAGAALTGVTSASAAATAAPAASQIDDCTGPVAGKHIYDCAHLLTPTEITTLETQAEAVVQAGAPTVVYLQVRDATADQALQDAIDLMNRWNVESHPGAHDGFVMFFDLQPGNLRHGEVALYAGAKHYQHGNLPRAELNRIRTDVMTPLLANGETAAGIAAGLQMVAHDLRYGPPPPPAYQTGAAAFGRIPFNVLAALLAGVVAFLFVRLGRLAPTSGEDGAVGLGSLASAASPGDLAPALAGALVKGRVSDGQMEATILDFARRGLLTIAPVGQHKVQMHLTGAGKGLTGYEQELWNDLVSHGSGTAGDQTLSSEDLVAVRQNWQWARSLLRRELIERGWYNPTAAAARRRPLYIAGAVGLLGVAIALVVIGMSQEAWAVIGLVICLAASVVAFVRGYAIPDTTVEGELAAAPWRGYRASVTDHSYEPNLDTDLPYIVGLGIVGQLTSRLKAASEQGYSPSWFRARGGRAGDQTVYAGGFYPYWIAFHSGMTPASSGGSASGGYAGGGAAGGGGGSAGSF